MRHTDGLIHCYRKMTEFYYLITFIVMPSIMTVCKSPGPRPIYVTVNSKTITDFSHVGSDSNYCMGIHVCV